MQFPGSTRSSLKVTVSIWPPTDAACTEEPYRAHRSALRSIAAGRRGKTGSREPSSVTAGASVDRPLNLQDSFLSSATVLLPAFSKGDQMEKQAGAGRPTRSRWWPRRDRTPKAAGEEPSRPSARARAGSRGRSQTPVAATVIKGKAHVPFREGEGGGRDGRGKPACKHPPGLPAASTACRGVKVSTPALGVCTHCLSSGKRNRVPGTPTLSPLAPVLTINLQARPRQRLPSLAREP